MNIGIDRGTDTTKTGSLLTGIYGTNNQIGNASQTVYTNTSPNNVVLSSSNMEINPEQVIDLRNNQQIRKHSSSAIEQYRNRGRGNGQMNHTFEGRLASDVTHNRFGSHLDHVKQQFNATE